MISIIRSLKKLNYKNIFIRTMYTVNNIKIERSFSKSDFVQPLRITYNENGKPKYWDLLNTNDSVAIIMYHLTRKKLIFVNQFRPDVYFNSIPRDYIDSCETIDLDKYPVSLGITLELCAGLVDKNKSLVETSKEEVLEECGYDVPENAFEKLHEFRIHLVQSLVSVFYCEVTDDMKIAEPESGIEVVELTLEEFYTEVSNSILKSPCSFILAYYWFLYHRSKYYDGKWRTVPIKF